MLGVFHSSSLSPGTGRCNAEELPPPQLPAGCYMYDKVDKFLDRTTEGNANHV